MTVPPPPPHPPSSPSPGTHCILHPLREIRGVHHIVPRSGHLISDILISATQHLMHTVASDACVGIMACLASPVDNIGRQPYMWYMVFIISYRHLHSWYLPSGYRSHNTYHHTVGYVRATMPWPSSVTHTPVVSLCRCVSHILTWSVHLISSTWTSVTQHLPSHSGLCESYHALSQPCNTHTPVSTLCRCVNHIEPWSVHLISSTWTSVTYYPTVGSDGCVGTTASPRSPVVHGRGSPLGVIHGVHRRSPLGVIHGVHRRSPLGVIHGVHRRSPLGVIHGVHRRSPLGVIHGVHRRSPLGVIHGVHRRSPLGVIHGVHRRSPLDVIHGVHHIQPSSLYRTHFLW